MLEGRLAWKWVFERLSRSPTNKTRCPCRKAQRGGGDEAYGSEAKITTSLPRRSRHTSYAGTVHESVINCESLPALTL